MSRTIHFALSLEAAQRMSGQELVGSIVKNDGTKPTIAEARRAVAEAAAAGFTVLPPCTNHDSRTGRCLGHEEPVIEYEGHPF